MRTNTVFWFLAIAGFFLTTASEGYTQQTFAVVNMKDIFDNSTQFQEIANQVQSEIRSREQEFRTEKETLDTQLEDLKQKQGIMDPETLQEQLREIAAQMQELRRQQLVAMQDIDQQKEEALVPVITELKDVMEEIAREEGYSLILNKRYLVYVDPSIDITDKVIARLNQ